MKHYVTYAVKIFRDSLLGFLWSTCYMLVGACVGYCVRGMRLKCCIGNLRTPTKKDEKVDRKTLKGSGGGDEGDSNLPSCSCKPFKSSQQEKVMDESLVEFPVGCRYVPAEKGACGAKRAIVTTTLTRTTQRYHQHDHRQHPPSTHHHHNVPQQHAPATDSCYSSSAASSPLPQRVAMSPDAGYYSPETTLTRSEQPAFESFQEDLPETDERFQHQESQHDDSFPEQSNMYDATVEEYHQKDVHEHLHQVEDSAYIEAKSYYVPSSIAKRKPLSSSLLSLTTSSDRSDSSEIDWAAKLNNGWLLPLDLEAVPYKIPFGGQRVPGTVPYRQLPPVKDPTEIRSSTPVSKGPSMIFRQQKTSGILGRSPLIDGLFIRPSRHRDELSDLLDLYSSLRLEEDEDLLIRAERRDLPERFQKKYRMLPRRRFNQPILRARKKSTDDTISLIHLHGKTPPSRRSAVPDRVLDDLAARRFAKQDRLLKDYEPRTPDSIPLPRDRRFPTQCYLRLSPLFTPPLECPCASLLNIFNEADAERDDVLYRSMLRKQWKGPERQPPMGIPLTAEKEPPQLSARGHYLTASRRDMRARYKTRPTTTADPVQDDMAVRRLRKDTLDAPKFTQVTRV